MGADVVIPGSTYTAPNVQITKPADAAAQAEFLARTKYPAEYQAAQTNKRLKDILGMMQGSAPGGTAMLGGR